MPFNGSGTYVATPLPGSWNPAATGSNATPTDWNTLLADISTALSTCVTKDGQTTLTGAGITSLKSQLGVGTVVRVTTFTASGTYTPNANLINGYTVGKGGGGGSAVISGSAGASNGGGGGAEGNTVTKYFQRVDVLPTVAVTIGAGGSSNAAGGDTTFGALLTAKGGNPGGTIVGGSSAGAAGNVGDIVIYGIPGGQGMQDANTSVAIGGNGGGAGGGVGAVTGGAGTGGNNGLAHRGGGGGGTGVVGAGGPFGTSIGGSGFLYVVEYCSA